MLLGYLLCTHFVPPQLGTVLAPFNEWVARQGRQDAKKAADHAAQFPTPPPQKMLGGIPAAAPQVALIGPMLYSHHMAVPGVTLFLACAGCTASVCCGIFLDLCCVYVLLSLCTVAFRSLGWRSI